MSVKGLAERLRAARAAANLTQEQVGDELNKKAQTIANYERGRSTPDPVDLPKLAALYRVSLDWLMTGEPRLEHRFEPAKTAPTDIEDEAASA